MAAQHDFVVTEVNTQTCGSLLFSVLDHHIHTMRKQFTILAMPAVYTERETAVPQTTSPTAKGSVRYLTIVQIWGAPSLTIIQLYKRIRNRKMEKSEADNLSYLPKPYPVACTISFSTVYELTLHG